MRHRSVLICPPKHFTIRDVKNPFMSLGKPVNRDLAWEQWEAFRAALERCGVVTQQIDPIEDLEDMVFAANQVFVARGAAHARFVVPSRMRHASRQREVPYFVRWFRDRGYDILDLALDGDAYFEGTGDAILQPEANHVWAACGVRSSVPPGSPNSQKRCARRPSM